MQVTRLNNVGLLVKVNIDGYHAHACVIIHAHIWIQAACIYVIHRSFITLLLVGGLKPYPKAFANQPSICQ